MISVYTSAFNIESASFDYEEAFLNYSLYASEIVVATMSSNDNTYDILRKYEEEGVRGVKVKVVFTDLKYEDYAFDGKLKDAALQACTNEFCIQQDLDERIGGDPKSWLDLFHFLQENKERGKAFFIPVINLYGSLETFTDVSFKWYAHLKEGCHRGVVNFAKKEDGFIDTDRSDTCELIDSNGDLVPFFNLGISTPLEPFKKGLPNVVHLGYLDLSRREKINDFWGPVWSNRKGSEVDNSLEDKEVFKHKISQLYKT